jgi:hypothetical protein
MRRGCIAQGLIYCSKCGGEINPANRYLVIDEDEKGNEVEEKGISHIYCVECALEKGYAHYRESKGERILSFLPDSE